MTINKSQGQTISKIGIYLPRPVFSHGQLYVALSRARSIDGIKVFISNPNDDYPSYTQNIVYTEILQDIGRLRHAYVFYCYLFVQFTFVLSEFHISFYRTLIMIIKFT